MACFEKLHMINPVLFLRRRSGCQELQVSGRAFRLEAGIGQLQSLLRHICLNGFEHHVAGTFSHVADAVHEATTRYLGWDVLRHA